MLELSLVIPCRNEAERLPGTLQTTMAYLSEERLDAEVLVVVEPGTDATPEILRRKAREDNRIRPILNSEARGKGFAVRTGMLAARAERVLFMDADLSVPIRFVGEFLPVLTAPVDVVIASRRHPESVIGRPQSLTRILSGRAFNAVLRLVGATGFADTQCGFKAFTAEASREVFSRALCDGFGFDVEALAIAEALGFRVEARPVEWNDAPGSKVRPIDGLKALAEALRGATRARGFRKARRA